MNALGPGEWMTMQSFILVKGTNPPGSSIKWDCNSADPRLHWTNDNERYVCGTGSPWCRRWPHDETSWSLTH